MVCALPLVTVVVVSNLGIFIQSKLRVLFFFKPQDFECLICTGNKLQIREDLVLAIGDSLQTAHTD